MRLYNIVLLIALSTFWLSDIVAQAQTTSPQQPSPSQIAIQVDGLINGWATAIEQLQMQTKQDQAQIADLKKQLEDVKNNSNTPPIDKQ